MFKQKKLHVKVGDLVTILSGFHKNETGEIKQFEAPIHHSNVKLSN
jgi:ribosomal protein L24